MVLKGALSNQIVTHRTVPLLNYYFYFKLPSVP